MNTANFFVTGTDTDAGKTYVSQALLHGLRQLQFKVYGFKPIAAGVDDTGLNSDAVCLRRASSEMLPYPQVNPILLQEPCAPHLVGTINQEQLHAWIQSLQHIPADYRLIEGAGGWLLPISPTSYLADIVAQQQWPVLLVVGMKLGCLNHTMLTYRELERAGVPLIGWVANQIDADMLKFEENLADLTARLPIPLLSVLPHQAQGATAEQSLQLAQAFISANAARQS